MDSNREEAERAKAEGKQAMQAGDFARAVRLFMISDRLVSNPDTRQLLSTAQAAVARQSGPRARPETAAGPAAAHTDGDRVSSLYRGLDRLLDEAWGHLPPVAKAHIHRNIHPSMRKPLGVLALLIVVLCVYRFVLRGPRFIWGGLPGDIYYQSQYVVVSAPVVSCLLLSGVMHFVQLYFRGAR